MKTNDRELRAAFDSSSESQSSNRVQCLSSDQIVRAVLGEIAPPEREQLLDHLEDVNSGKCEMPSVIFLDVNMPLLDGFETVMAVRKNEHFKERPEIVMFTVSNNPEDMERALSVGANGYKVKPFGVDEFVQFANSLIPSALS